MRRLREADVLLPESLERLVCRQPQRSDVDLDEVGLYLFEVDRQAGRVQALRKAPRPGVILRKPLDVVVERVDPRRGA